jgi:hypothetical protein
MGDLFSLEFLGVLVLAIVISAMVALVAIRKKIGYGWAFVTSFLLSLVFIFARLPYPIWISAAICLVAFVLWPKRNLAMEAKN